MQEKPSSQIPAFCIKLNSDNNLYLIPQGDKLGLTFGFNFNQKTDISLVRVFLQELEDAKRHVKNSIESKFYPDMTKPPQEIKGIENNPERYNSGMLSMSNFLY